MNDAPAHLPDRLVARTRLAGLFWLAFATLGAFIFFWQGIETLLVSWKQPEYSHGPLIPVLSAILFLRQLKEEPIHTGPVNRIPGLVLLGLSLILALFGKMAEIGDVTAYALILWVGAILLISFGWDQGRRFWPPVVHLAFMLPLPGVLYYKVSTDLQFISSELGVWFLKLLNVPVFLDGNVIDLGVMKLHVAEACSGLRYLFPILSFSYIFAVLFQGPMTHKAILLLSAAPISVLMNSVRIAMAGVIVQYFGIDHVEGFSHFFEGWVIFILCVLLLFALARFLLLFRPGRPSLVDAMDLEYSGLVEQSRRLLLVEPSRSLAAAAVITALAALAWQVSPGARTVTPDRADFAAFPDRLGDWTVGRRDALPPDITAILNPQDYLLTSATNPAGERVDIFLSWFSDQTVSGAHSPEVCLPGAGWEFSTLDRVDLGPALGLARPYPVNRAILQFGEERLLAYYFFRQNGRQLAWDFGSKLWLLWDGVLDGRKDGGLVRIITPLARGEDPAAADRRLQDLLLRMEPVLSDYLPD
ncbi:VPLPA-CTERM-specific exosortase XrtD [Tabrizicola sp. TH137]|uniref:VPLPA-CTERM-specific exosortase XrtD n=1 Tax=Tabrizicola sp. TH137 TaxID=2067452 RepID=UPI000C7E767F|nr:VPLPA-CTERM-specific exosortase XrtD [Tabrizicola sp. TH137]PLL10761.1 VPLPA-CTERM-specific exosortase XrtD [Tabrizicola sp. TH137]